MPRYDYRCRTCDSLFEVRRAISDPAGEERCPQGHAETSRVFTPVAVGGVAVGGAAVGGRALDGAAGAPAAGGGCCGGGCCG